jgi:hypothetical protein
VHPQHGGRLAQGVRQDRRVASGRRRELAGAGPGLPVAGQLGTGGGRARGEACRRERTRGPGVRRKGKRNRPGCCGKLSAEDDKTRPGVREIPGHGVVTAEILPQVGGSEVARACPAEPRCARQAQKPPGTLREQRSSRVHPDGIVGAAAEILVGIYGRMLLQMACQENIKLRVGNTVERVADQHDVTSGIGYDLQCQLIGMLRRAYMDDRRQGHCGIGGLHLVSRDCLHLIPPAVTSHDETHVTNLRFTGCGPVHLIKDALTHGRPYAAGTQASCDGVFGAGSHYRADRKARCRGTRHVWTSSWASNNTKDGKEKG